MLTCLLYAILWVIVAVIVIWIIETLVSQFMPIPPPIMMLIRLFMAVLVLIWCLDCIGLVEGPALFHRPIR